MAVSKALRARTLASVVLAAGVALLGWVLLVPDWQLATVSQQVSYDALHALSGINFEATDHSPVVVVYLDLDAYTQRKLDPAKPWPRELHAELLRRLQTAGAKAVVFDIVFSSAGPDAAADTALAEAIRDSGNVILAAEYNDKVSVATDNEHSGAKLGAVGNIYEPFVRAAAGVGIASLGIDDDRAVRRFVAGFTASEQPALAWAAAIALHLPVTPAANSMAAKNQSWIRYYGPPLTIPHVSYSQALTSDGVKDDFFRGKIVLVGARPHVGAFNERQDEFRSPFHSWKNKELFLPGVEVHATQLLNLVRNDDLRRLPSGAETLALLLVAIVFGGGLVWLRPIPATLAAVAGGGVSLALARAGFGQGIWFPWLIVSAAQIRRRLAGRSCSTVSSGIVPANALKPPSGSPTPKFANKQRSLTRRTTPSWFRT
ncbi:MAG: CHASE2 domain-containing protein [Verrucomicrobiota bacterium]